jgi:hypothetical protein
LPHQLVIKQRVGELLQSELYERREIAPAGHGFPVGAYL